jgi:hypothetical protein
LEKRLKGAAFESEVSAKDTGVENDFHNVQEQLLPGPNIRWVGLWERTTEPIKAFEQLLAMHSD